MKTKSLWLLLSLFSIVASAQSQKKAYSVTSGPGNYLKTGTMAPAFSLPNVMGETISLADFKGKVVYIDFWGVDCKPCMAEIKNYVPQLHEHYKDKNVVFINICVEGDEKRWKETVNQYHVDGINLFAEGWVKNPVCQAYHVSPIPHYILIDKTGKIVDGNATRPTEINLKSGRNAIDALLKK